MPTFQTGDGTRTLFRCSCVGGWGCDSEIELVKEEAEGGDVWLYVKARPATLLQCLRWWWRQRWVWVTDMVLKKEDLVKMRDVLDTLSK